MPNESSHFVSPEALSRKHEARDPSAGKIFLAALSVPLMVILSFVTVSWMRAVWSRARPADPEFRLRGAIVAPNDQLLERFPKPNLQLNPHADLVAMQARDATALNSYGWVDRRAGVVSIPIDRAMDLLLQRGLPVRPTNGPAHTGKSEFELIKERPEQK